MSRVLPGVLVALVALGGCSTASGGDRDVRTAGIYEAALRWALMEERLRPTEDGDLPVVYVVASDGDPAPPEVQVEVVKNLMDDANLRFTDLRDDALHPDEEGRPVKDEGLLVLVGMVPEEGLLVDIAVSLYRSEEENRPFLLRLAGSGARWNVTDAEPVEPAG